LTLIASVSGIRGTIGGKAGESLSPIDLVQFSAAFGAWLQKRSDNKLVVVGRDARTSGPMIQPLVVSTLQAMGLEILLLDLSTTPTVQMAVMMEKAAGGIMLSASHNPGQWNALKLFNEKGEYLTAKEGKEMMRYTKKGAVQFADVKKMGVIKEDHEYLKKHIEEILKLPLVNKEAIQSRNFKVVIDAVNSTGGIAVPMLLEALGVTQMHRMYCEPNGHFPHNPEPLPENLTAICQEMEKGHYDLGIVVDPDVDRLCFVNEDGRLFGEEYTLVAIADYVLKHKQGPTVSNLSSSRALRDVTEKHNQIYYTSAVGEAWVVEAMKKHHAVIGGEGNGGIIVPELHYGRDALAGIALFLSHLALFGKSSSMLRSTYPDYFISKNKIELDASLNPDKIIAALKEQYHKQPINDIDGVKIEFDKEWVHLRKSNTEPIIRIYAESNSMATANHLAQKIMEDIREIVEQQNAGLSR
jgi:phosphomannomutase